MSETWGGARSAMEPEQPEQPQMNAELVAQGAKLEHEFAAGYPQWRNHPRLGEAAAKVAKAAQEAGEDLGLWDERVGAMNRCEFYHNVARELEAEHSVSGQLRKMQGRRR